MTVKSGLYLQEIELCEKIMRRGIIGENRLF